MTNETERVPTLIVGGGQAGLSVGYHLARRGQEFLILDENRRVGDQWRQAAWDSMRLFSPAKYDGLPGLPYPGPRHAFPTRDEFADYLHDYAQRFELPIRPGVAVGGLRRQGDGFLVAAGGLRFEADQVVVAVGPHHVPHTPSIAAQLDPAIRQLHSSEYRNPAQLRPGPVLVVGASHSGADIALELAASHPTVLCGRFHGQLPWRLETRRARLILPVQWFVFRHVLTARTPPGRLMRKAVRSHGAPLLRVKKADLAAAGVERVLDRVTGVRDGLPVLGDGRVIEAANVIWCTGFRQDYGWIDLPVTDGDGYPVQKRGLSPEPGLYFVGVPFLYSFASMLIGGIDRDAGYVAQRIAARAARTGPTTREAEVAGAERA
ncbi:putative flavoprotein involved in K+ transport [Streptacidiphilus sp. MAP12-20]|uniref:flavin-containing monooxygenase n=1 Tax=Streptacidiphilus sp. MAP12-20 TaxID=3156299 RepID=UPI0035188107